MTDAKQNQFAQVLEEKLLEALKSSEATIYELIGVIHQKEAKISELRMQIGNNSKYIDTHVAMYENSRSWKITKPLRDAARLARRIGILKG